MWEQQTVLAKLGTSEEAARVRAKMQSSSLLSDMQAFKVSRTEHAQYDVWMVQVLIFCLRLRILDVSWRIL